jgi:hypothetical protein
VFNIVIDAVGHFFSVLEIVMMNTIGAVRLGDLSNAWMMLCAYVINVIRILLLDYTERFLCTAGTMSLMRLGMKGYYHRHPHQK